MGDIDDTPIDLAIVERADRQYGVVTRADLREFGLE